MHQENAKVEAALEKGARGERLEIDDALALGDLDTPGGLHALGAAARSNRLRRFENRATFVTNLQINPSNVCEGECRFCHYSVSREEDEGAYVLSEEEILRRVDAVDPVEVHIVGGMNSIWDFKRNVALIAAIKAERPDIHVKAFTAVEIDFFARSEKTTTEAILAELKQVGLAGMPGGGAELFSERMRTTYCPNKLSPAAWLDIHRQAHALGLTTNATMLYGLDETHAERVEHMLAIRQAQDESGGYACFVPLPYQPGKDHDPIEGPSPLVNLGVIALARLLLDNVDHIKAYWPMIGLETTSAALSWGADDLDGTIGGERIAHAAGAKTPSALSRDRMRTTIRFGGFEPRERDGRFRSIGSSDGKCSEEKPVDR